jgi:uncharacterized membrane protein
MEMTTLEELERLRDAHIMSDTEESAREFADAAINALPGLLAIRNAAKTALGHLDDPTGGDAINDMRQASDVLRAALAKDATT